MSSSKSSDLIFINFRIGFLELNWVPDVTKHTIELYPFLKTRNREMAYISPSLASQY